jgi:hypothetical protein
MVLEKFESSTTSSGNSVGSRMRGRRGWRGWRALVGAKCGRFTTVTEPARWERESS